MDKTALVGIDPGLDGALAILRDDSDSVELHLMPTLPSGVGGKRMLDLVRIRDLLLDANPAHVAIESQQPFPKQGGCSNFTTGHNYGALCGLLVGLEISWGAVRPREWQKVYGIGRGDTKAQSVVVCQRLFPRACLLPTPRCHVPHDGLADAALIAEYVRRR
jgi:hypothetical protein